MRDPLPCPIRVPYCSWCSQCVPSVISTVRGVPSVYPVCSLCSQCVPSKDFLKENSETLNIKWGTNSKRTRWETLYPAPSYVLSVLSLWSTLLVVFPVCNWSMFPSVLSVFLLWYLLLWELWCSQCVPCVFPMFPARSLKRLFKGKLRDIEH